MPEYVINGIMVKFPFEPYTVQRNYMTKVIECLQNGTNGVLESPTGTGKTLSLLCSTLGWLSHKKGTLSVLHVQSTKQDKLTGIQLHEHDLEQARIRLPKIIYTSRTHSQLTQAMQEMKRTEYRDMRAVALGSRDQTCIHPEVSKEDGNASKSGACKALVQARSCYFYNRVESCKGRPEIAGSTIMDIEDLVKVGTKLKACPFYLSKELVEESDILFMPYNYLLDPMARKANNLQISNTVIILDEAHNVEKMCEESASVQFRSSDIALCIDDVTSVMKLMEQTGTMPEDTGDKKDFTIDDLVLLKEMFLSLEKVIDEIPAVSSVGKNFDGVYIFELLEKANIKRSNYGIVMQLIESISTFVATTALKNNFVKRGTGLQIFADALGIIFVTCSQPDYMQVVKKCYKVHVGIEEKRNVAGNVKQADGWTATKKLVPSAKQNAKVINFWCFNPGLGMQMLLGGCPRSIILTSGTLAPLRPFISELGLPVAERLENPHIINDNQVLVKVIRHGPDKELLNSCYTNRDNPKYVQSLGRTILSLCPIIPDGLLVFFPSYQLLNKCSEAWQESGLWQQISRIKPIFVEPRKKGEFLTTMTEYCETINNPQGKGAIFVAVCRGKVSEGLDFADKNGRAVIITGLPFPPLMDQRIVLKKKYLQEVRTKENEIISGDEWYSLEASRTVNQAIGRVIRHKNDYGAILLCDSRFADMRQRAQLSSWVQRRVEITQDAKFGPVIKDISTFFKSAAKNYTLIDKTNKLPPDESASSLVSTREEDKTLTLSASTSQEQHAKLSNYKPSFINTNRSQHPIFKNVDSEDSIISTYASLSLPKPEPEEQYNEPTEFLRQIRKPIKTINFNNMGSYSSNNSLNLPPLLLKSSTSTATVSNETMSTNTNSEEGQSMPTRSFRRLTNTLATTSWKSIPNSEEKIDSSVLPPEQKFSLRPSMLSTKRERSDQCHQQSPELMKKSKHETIDLTGTKGSDRDTQEKNNITIVPGDAMSRQEFMHRIKSSISTEQYKTFLKGIMIYREKKCFESLWSSLVQALDRPDLWCLLRAMRRYLTEEQHQNLFDERLKSLCGSATEPEIRDA